MRKLFEDYQYNVAAADSTSSFTDSLHHPLLLAKRTTIVLFHPQTHAAVVKGVVAVAPYDHAIIMLIFGLTSETGVHDLNPADGARVAFHVPTPHGHPVPLFEGEHFPTAVGRRGGRRRAFSVGNDGCVFHRFVGVSHFEFLGYILSDLVARLNVRSVLRRFANPNVFFSLLIAFSSEDRFFHRGQASCNRSRDGDNGPGRCADAGVPG